MRMKQKMPTDKFQLQEDEIILWRGRPVKMRAKSLYDKKARGLRILTWVDIIFTLIYNVGLNCAMFSIFSQGIERIVLLVIFIPFCSATTLISIIVSEFWFCRYIENYSNEHFMTYVVSNKRVVMVWADGEIICQKDIRHLENVKFLPVYENDGHIFLGEEMLAPYLIGTGFYSFRIKPYLFKWYSRYDLSCEGFSFYQYFRCPEKHFTFFNIENAKEVCDLIYDIRVNGRLLS